uniref:Secreted protein n=1 Tax=Ascaris lumbricoides TaxID=6252 RepID=A0A0M3I9C5_ASCLU
MQHPVLRASFYLVSLPNAFCEWRLFAVAIHKSTIILFFKILLMKFKCTFNRPCRPTYCLCFCQHDEKVKDFLHHLELSQ